MAYYSIKDVPWHDYKWYEGPKGLGGYTTKADKYGYYHSFFCKPVGKGARIGVTNTYVYVPRLTSKRRKKVDARARSYNLAFGKPITSGVKVRPAKKNPPGTGYCMAEKKHVFVEGWSIILASNGRDMLQGQCPDCGCKIQKYGKLINCPECGKVGEGSAGDYLCKVCRWEADNGLEQVQNQDDD